MATPTETILTILQGSPFFRDTSSLTSESLFLIAVSPRLSGTPDANGVQPSGSDYPAFVLKLGSNFPGVAFTFFDLPNAATKLGDFADLIEGKLAVLAPKTLAARGLAPRQVGGGVTNIADTEEAEETFESFLIKHGIDVFGKWSDPNNETTLEICHCHPSKKGATVKWTSTLPNGMGVAFGLMGGDEEISPLVKGAKKTTRTVADGFCFVENGDWDQYKMIATFKFKKTTSTAIASRELEIRPMSKANALDEYSFVVISCDPENPESNRATLFDHKKNQVGVLTMEWKSKM